MTAPSSPGANDGVIDLFIDEGTAPYFITYSKDDGSCSFSIEYEITAQNNGDEDYLNASEGIYRISITDAHCASLSLDIIVSLDCTCNLPILNYEDAECLLYWQNDCEEDGSGYTYFLQHQSNGA